MPLTFEFDEDELTLTCSCCDRPVRWMQGFVQIDAGTSAMYSATFSPSHRDRRIHIAIGVGDWSDEANAEDRFVAALQVWVETRDGERGIVTGFVEKTDMIVPPPDKWGRFRSGEAMRKDSRRDEVLELVQQILASDPRLARYVLTDMSSG